MDQPHDKFSWKFADLVPVYHLGQTQLLTFWGTESMSRSWRMSVGLFWGAYGLPLPRKSQIISLVGAPIPGEDFGVQLGGIMLDRCVAFGPLL